MLNQSELLRLADRNGRIKVDCSGLIWLQLRAAVKQGLLVQLSYFVFSLPEGG